MIKLFAAFFLIFGCWGIGKSRHARLRFRTGRLVHILDGLLCMESDIRALCAPLPTTFARAGRYDSLFAAAATHCETKDGENAFLAALHETDLNKEETEILSVFAKGLSAADSMGQLQNIATVRSRLETLVGEIQEKADRLAKLYSGGGMMTGVLLVLLLM